MYYLSLSPLYTTDLLRNLGFGNGFWELGCMYNCVPFDFSPSPAQFLWPTHYYTYPAATFFFFAALVKVHSSLFFGKLALTLLDVCNSCLIHRISKDRWLALLYWINPISVWYTSREGQFEAWVIFWMLIALYGLRRNKAWAFGALGLAIQTKLFPVFLVPYFLIQMSWREPSRLAKEFGWGLLSLLPSLLVMSIDGVAYLSRYFSAGYMPRFNPISWIPIGPELYPVFPLWLLAAHWLAGVVFILGCFQGLRRTGDYIGFAAPILFVAAVKANVIGQFWYLMLTPAFCLTVKDPRWRRFLFVLAFLLGVRSLYSIFIGPIGYQNPPDAQYLMDVCYWGY